MLSARPVAVMLTTVMLAPVAGCSGNAARTPPPSAETVAPEARITSTASPAATTATPIRSARATHALSSTEPEPTVSPTHAFTGSITELTSAERSAMTGVSWHPGCPVPLADLRNLSVTYWGFDDASHQGVLIVHRDVAEDLEWVFAQLYAERFPIRSMRPIDEFDGNDYDSIEADNTSAFNCRRRTGSSQEWSRHAYGRALDLNPLENPYITEQGTTSHSGSRRYLDRSIVRPGMIVADSVPVRTFNEIGWRWGGLWPRPTDLQHFSDNDR